MLITGGSGFIGRHISGKRLKGDLLCMPALHEREKHLMHLAWEVTPGSFWEDPINDRWAKASMHLIDQFFDQGGVHVIVAGSSAESGQTRYGLAKRALLQWLKKRGYPFAWARIYHVYGPYEKKERLVPLLIRNKLSNQTTHLSNANQVCDYLHVTDVAKAFTSLVGVRGEFDIGSGQAITVREIAEIIGGECEFGEGAQKPLVAKRLPLNWKPTYGIKEGLLETIEWYKREKCHS